MSTRRCRARTDERWTLLEQCQFSHFSHPALRSRFTAVVEGAGARGWRFPLVAVNGTIVTGADEGAPYPLAVERLVQLIHAVL